MGQLQYVMGEAGWPDPGPARGTPHLLPTGSPLQLTFSRSSSSSSTMSRRLFTARLDSFSCGKKTVCSYTNVRTKPHSAGRGGAGRGRGSAPTWDSSSSSSSKVKARNLELCQYSSSSARALLICNGATRPQRRSRPVPQSAAPRRRHSPPRAPLPPQAAAQQRHGTGGRAAAARGTPGRAVCTPPSARSRAAVGLQVPACTARLRAPVCDSRLLTRGGAGSGPLLAAAP